MTHLEQKSNHPAGMREWVLRAGLVFASLVVAIVLAEICSRLFIPISERRDNITLTGERITGFVEPGVTYRQISNEYDALTTITDEGYRVPKASGNPDVVFIGDSFTFGFGLADDQTFVNRYCSTLGLQCANLGYPGSGTLQQVERLERFLENYEWRPKTVKLFFFGMSTSFSAGNDFVDNYDREIRRRSQRSLAESATREQPRGGIAEALIGLQPLLLRHSNLVRLLKFYAGPMLKSLIIADPGEERMSIALEATRNALNKLDQLSRRVGFDYQIYLIVPVHDILRGTAGDTLAILNSVAPRPAIPTAHALSDSPKDFYFAFDGHLNPEGSRRIAELMIAEDAAN